MKTWQEERTIIEAEMERRHDRLKSFFRAAGIELGQDSGGNPAWEKAIGVKSYAQMSGGDQWSANVPLEKVPLFLLCLTTLGYPINDTDRLDSNGQRIIVYGGSSVVHDNILADTIQAR